MKDIVNESYGRLKALDGEILEVDGVRVDFGDGWFIARASGTEPKIRIGAEAREESRAKELFDLCDKIITEVIG